ncbi:MAG: TonB-dependent receptor plug domain-containing protein, partial [candidate division Zixibacteria bacterium]|nr:TonB-dependent receptor plug domain-containing protein [candidate division Zixibacteria bacterium]
IESLTDKVCSLFTTNYVISSENIENSIYKSLGGLLKTYRGIDITSYGPYGQPEYATIWGGTSRQLLIYQDDISFFQQAIYLPQTGDHDLFTIPIENIENIQIIDNPVASILGRGTGIGGLRLKSKEFKTDQPYSRINFERGPYGYRKTQIDFGKNLSKKIGFYFTSGWKKSDSPQANVNNSNFKSLYLTSNLLFKMRKNWKVKVKAFHFENRAGNPLPYESAIALKTKGDSWILDLGSDYYFKNKSLLKIDGLFNSHSAKSYNGGYFLDREEDGNESSLKGSYEFYWKGKIQNRIEGYFSWGNVTLEEVNKSLKEGYLSYLGFSKLFRIFDAFVFYRLNLQQGFRWTYSAMEGISYKPHKEFKLFLNFANSCTNPSYHDLYLKRSSYSAFSDSLYFSYSECYNDFLVHECLFSVNSGFSWVKKEFSLSSSIFYSFNQDNIEWTSYKNIDTYPSFSSVRYQYCTSNRERNLFGLSLNYDYIFSPNFETGFSYAYKRARSDKNYHFPYAPEHSLFSYFQYSNEYLSREIGIKVRLEQEYLSRRYLADYDQDQVPFALLFNSKITLRFLGFQFYYVIENITNEIYRTRGDFNMPGRTLWFGFSWEFYD